MTADEIRRLIQTVQDEHRTLLRPFDWASDRRAFGTLVEGYRLPESNAEGESHSVAQTVVDAEDEREQADAAMPAVLSAVLQMHSQASRWTGANDLVFARADGAPLSADTLWLRVLYPALLSIGIARERNRRGFHLFRHSAASIVHAQTRHASLASGTFRSLAA